MNRATTPAAARTKKKTKPKLRTTILITEQAWNQGDRQARREKRNFSNYVEWLIDKDVQANPRGSKA